jgi:hypothetical protein
MLCFDENVGLQRWWGWCGTAVHDVGLCTMWESLLHQTGEIQSAGQIRLGGQVFRYAL